MVCFADLKKYKFTYLFGFPALQSDPPWLLGSDEGPTVHSEDSESSALLGERLTADESTALVESVQTWRYSVDARQYGFFLAKKIRASSSPKVQEENTERKRPMTPGTPGVNIGFTWAIGSLAHYEQGFFDDAYPADCFICFTDPSNYPIHPGWMLRNLLVLVRQRWKLDLAHIMCYRDTQSQRHEARSFILTLKTERLSSPSYDHAHFDTEGFAPNIEMPKVFGWERNQSKKITSRIANLGEYMDPQRSAGQLNEPRTIS